MIRAAQVIGALALLTAVASVGWRAAALHETPPALAATASAVATSASRSQPVSRGMLTPGVAPTPAATVSATVAAPQVFAPGEVEVCGFGTAPADSPAAAQMATRANEGLERLLDEHLRRMARSSDERTRAAALMALGDTAALVAMAARTGNPTVFAFAQQACLRRDAKDIGSPCALVSDEQGARLDPGNGAAWLKVADGARLRGEADNMVAALWRVAGSAVHEAREFGFLALAIDAVPSGTGEADRLRLLTGLIGIQAALALPSHLAITTWCTEALAREVNRRPLCEGLAEHLVARGSLLIHTGIGARMGERVGWSAERVERVRARQHAMDLAQSQATERAPGGPAGCEALRIGERWWGDSARHGERTVAELWLAQAQVSDAQLIDRYREFQRRRAASTPGR